MDSQQFDQVMNLFQAACALPESARARFVENQCADPDIRREVGRLLYHDARPVDAVAVGAGAQLLAQGISHEHSTAATTLVTPSAVTPLPDRRPHILSGQYRIIRVIGEGGMGVVYEAEQARPRRRVALKAIRPGMASRQTLLRFEREAHILGRLHHPGIAQIYEAGAADELQPDHAYFSMEYVPGLPLTRYAQVNRLDTRARVALFIRICEAVQYAHQHGVIHRDLKPGNILVNESGDPKILDFGVARLMDDDTQLATLQTQSGQLIGTLPYMSPEQISGDSDGIDTRSDVFTLGVVLYYLLSGQLPLETGGKPIAHVLQLMREERPRALGECDRSLRGDLETIVGKAMEREIERRYQSAVELIADLRRFLKGEPIDAKRDSLGYVLVKKMRRHRGRMVVIGCVLALAGVLVAQAVSARRSDPHQHASEYLQAMIRAYNARARGDQAVYTQSLSYLEKELGVDGRQVVALIDQTIPPLLAGASSKPAD